MNKLLRNQLKRKHYLRRIKLRALWNDVKWVQIYGAKWTNRYRTSGKPCSCSLCSLEKYNRAEFKKWKNEKYDCPYDDHVVDIAERECRYCEGCEWIIDKMREDDKLD